MIWVSKVLQRKTVLAFYKAQKWRIINFVKLEMQCWLQARKYEGLINLIPWKSLNLSISCKTSMRVTLSKRNASCTFSITFQDKCGLFSWPTAISHKSSKLKLHFPMVNRKTVFCVAPVWLLCAWRAWLYSLFRRTSFKGIHISCTASVVAWHVCDHTN